MEPCHTIIQPPGVCSYKQSRTYLCCNNSETEDEIHFLIKCDAYKDIREKLVFNLTKHLNKNISQSSIYNMLTMLNSNSIVISNILSNYTEECLKIRENTI